MRSVNKYVRVYKHTETLFIHSTAVDNSPIYKLYKSLQLGQKEHDGASERE